MNDQQRDGITPFPTVSPDQIGNWYDGPETFVIAQAKDVQLGAQTYALTQPQAQQAAAVPAGFKLQVMDAADVYAKCAAKAHAERLYGTSTSYTNECTKRENEMRTSLQSLLAAAPPPPVLPLSDEHIDKIREALVEKMLAARMLVGDDAWDAWDHSLARAIERAHGVTEPGAGGEGV